MHVFCYTHRESAGLSGIEAAMAGAKLYIPSNILGRTLIKRDLLKDGVNHDIILPYVCKFYDQFVMDIEKGIDRKLNHERLAYSKNTWENASNIIHDIIR